MRILGFSKKWPKLRNPEFTTFRFTRRDKDWQVGELVQVIYKPRRKGGGEKLGIAEIIGREPRFIFSQGRHPLSVVTIAEAKADGFSGYVDMTLWLIKAHSRERLISEPMNKLTLGWVEPARRDPSGRTVGGFSDCD